MSADTDMLPMVAVQSSDWSFARIRLAMQFILICYGRCWGRSEKIIVHAV